MKPKTKTSAMEASVRSRLAKLARAKGINLELLLVRYTLERLLYRLGQSQYGSRFILKGAMLQTVWLDDLFRPTRDLDLLAYGDQSTEHVKTVFGEILSIKSDDGILFDIESLSVEPIREQTEYGGLRIEATSRLAGARIKVQIDLGFGDAVTPQAKKIDYPVLLDSPMPKILAYPKETVVAEKLQAIVVLGANNGRMKDFYDLWMMSQHLAFDGALLAKAVAATFARRQTPLPAETPVGLSRNFAMDADAIKRWGFFRTRNVLNQPPGSLDSVVAELNAFLMPAIALAREPDSSPIMWEPGGPWKP